LDKVGWPIILDLRRFTLPSVKQQTALALMNSPVGLDAWLHDAYRRHAMKKIFLSLVLLAGLVVLGVSLLGAADTSKPLHKGKVLLLKNEHVLEGDIERVGDRYRVRRLIGETWVPAERVTCLVASMPDAYAYLRERVNLEDADERLRLAHWCRLNGLRKQALTEMQAAVDLRPARAEWRRLLVHLRQAAQTETAEPAPTAEPPAPVPEVPPVDLTTETIGAFATRVQPILMNLCVRCHGTGRGGNFHLTQAFDGGIANRKTLERNVAAVLEQINVNHLEASRLLTKAVSDHAHVGQSPIKSRKDAPYRALESWVKLTVENNPHLRDSSPATTPSTPAKSPQSDNAFRNLPESSKTQWGVEASLLMPGPNKTVSRAVPATPPPSAPVGPVDPYDPEPYNRQLHPEKNPLPGPGK
jgi:hypothetical protein